MSSPDFTGQLLPDGRVVAGLTEDNLWLVPDVCDHPEPLNWEQAMAIGTLPTLEELNLLWENRDRISGGLEAIGIDTSASGSYYSYYWSSTDNLTYNAWIERFSDGGQSTNHKSKSNRVRFAQRLSDSEVLRLIGSMSWGRRSAMTDMQEK